MRKNPKYPIGYIFKYENVTLKVVEQPCGNCGPCYFKNFKNSSCNLPCASYERMDEKFVCFKEIDNSKNI